MTKAKGHACKDHCGFNIVLCQGFKKQTPKQDFFSKSNA